MIDLPPPPPAVEQPAPNDAGTIVTALGVAMTPPDTTGSATTPATQTKGNVAWRQNLRNKGVDLTFAYQSESAAAFTGGARDGSAYTQQLLASVAVDTGKAFGLRGGKFIFTVIHRKGVDLTATRLGNLFEVQELYGGGQDFRPANITYEQEFNHGRTAVKIGIYNSGADFATLPSGCNFQNFAFCPRPTTLFYNSGFSGFPVPRWGLRVKQQIGGGWAISTAIFEVNSLRAQSFHGWDLAPRFDSAVIPVELQWKGGQRPGQLPTLIRFGGLIDTTNKPDVYADVNGNNYSLTGLSPATRQERWSAWAMGERAWPIWARAARVCSACSARSPSRTCTPPASPISPAAAWWPRASGRRGPVTLRGSAWSMPASTRAPPTANWALSRRARTSSSRPMKPAPKSITERSSGRCCCGPICNISTMSEDHPPTAMRWWAA
jgi:hypothetical protein